MTDDLVAFLRARLDEDEQIARAASTNSPTWDAIIDDDFGFVSGIGLSGVHTDGFVDDAAAEHIARHDPARVLREIEAKRRLIDGLVEYMQIMASPYADHPDYRQEWRAEASE